MAGFQLIELSVISAQNLAQVTKSVRAYAVAWVHSDRKLTTQIDQEGHTNPTWNEKFMFRVDDNFLNSQNAVIIIEIYSSEWLRDVLIGTVSVLVSNLIPPNRKPKLRFATLQIRGPSGRPQGILNIGATLLNTNIRNMPLYSELSSSFDDIGYWENKKSKKNKNANSEEDSSSPFDSRFLTLQRCNSENDSTINDYTYHGNEKPGKDYYGYDNDDEQDYYGKPEMGVPKGGVFNEGSLCSNVEFYPMPPPPPPPFTAESSTIDGWSDDRSTGTQRRMKTKMEKWRAELTPAYEDYDDDERTTLTQPSPRVGKTPRRGGGRGGPCSCFGKMFGMEVKITYGSGNSGKKRTGGKGRRTNTSSQRSFDDSYL